MVCNQQDEKQQDCRRRNILYENQRQTCKVNVLKDGEESNILMKDGKGLYIGESSRSVVPCMNVPKNIRRTERMTATK